jgi:6-phosphogluconolactonase
VDAAGRTVAIANYGDGSVSTVKLDDDGVPGATASVISRTGSGPNKPRQNGPHAHGVYFDKTNTYLFVPDLGLDQVFVYPFDEGTSKLGTPLASLMVTPGAGPRHMAFSADEKNAYIINELDNSVLATSYASGKFKSLGAVLTLPQDFSGVSTTAEIEIHPNGRFLYASNRGHNSIAVYRRDEKTGTLVSIQIAPCSGRTPRHFKIDPSGKWLLCAYQDSNTISVLAINPETGLLGDVSSTVSVPGPICLLFGR